MKFNPTVHRTTDAGDPERTESGELKLRTDWQARAVDHKGRKFSPQIHGEKAELDDDGLIKMKRRDPNRKPMTLTNRTEAFVNQYRENGYVYRVVNDEPGRLDQFRKHDWEQVIGKDGPAMQHAGQARAPGTKSFLMKKPEEWYEEDQQRKDDVLKKLIATKTKPNEAEGQYDAGGLKSVLR